MNKSYILKKKTFLEVHSSGEKNKKPALLFLHGAGAHPIQFQKQLCFFSQKYFVLSIGLHGHSSYFKEKQYKSEDFKLPKLAEDVLYVLNETGVEKVHLVGNSAGGLTGFEMIKKSPETIQSLVTFGTCPKLSYPSWIVKMISKTDERMIRKKPEKYLRFTAKQSTPHSAVANEIVSLMMDSKHVAHLIRANIGNYNYLDLLTELRIPYLIIRGRYDKSINKCLKKVEKVIEANEKIRVADFAQSGHFANLDECDLFNSTVMEFIENV
ncbi:putative Beta-ketoadipate enol-lactone hydrolase [Chitinispirillum alkaliphilum]|nr:putative Beta-ketoadipate enol-lactone hydrolase [Chitinispirillum alkaliphilum]